MKVIDAEFEEILPPNTVVLPATWPQKLTAITSVLGMLFFLVLVIHQIFFM